MIKVRSDNRTVGENATRSTTKAAMAGEQARARASEKARAAAMKLPAGPSFAASTEVQPPHRRPVIR
jgi:hypothetical protein